MQVSTCHYINAQIKKKKKKINIEPLSFARTYHKYQREISRRNRIPLKSRIMSEFPHLQKVSRIAILKKSFLSRIGAYFALKMKQ